MQRVQYRFGFELSQSLTLVSIQRLCGALDVVEGAEERQRFLGQWALVTHPQLVELSSGMRHAADLYHILRKQRLVAREVVTHQLAAPTFQEAPGVFA